MRRVFEAFQLDPEADTPGRRVVRHIGESLVRAMEMALEAGHPEGAQLPAVLPPPEEEREVKTAIGAAPGQAGPHGDAVALPE